MTIVPDIRASDMQVLDWYAGVRPLCLARLRNSFDAATGLFSRQLRNGAWAPTLGTEAATSTAIVLIALSRSNEAILSSDERSRALEALAREVRAKGYHCGLGIALWANAVNDGLAFSPFLAACGVAEGEVTRIFSEANSMELAWLLAGLLHEHLRALSPTIDRLASETLAALLDRQCPTGLFLHATRDAPFAERVRRSVATFADQIYSIMALAYARIALGDEPTLGAALACADALLSRQGSLHQWWWHYEPNGGAVSRHYPVYAVHQHGMAPMAFQLLAAAGASAYTRRAWPGLGWIAKNELDIDLLDKNAGTVWRDVEPRRSRIVALLCSVGEVAGVAVDSQDATNLDLNCETRPYEWAWCLMAEALLTSPRPAGHLA
jgi:hypothetical protein